MNREIHILKTQEMSMVRCYSWDNDSMSNHALERNTTTEISKVVVQRPERDIAEIYQQVSSQVVIRNNLTIIYEYEPFLAFYVMTNNKSVDLFYIYGEERRAKLNGAVTNVVIISSIVDLLRTAIENKQMTVLSTLDKQHVICHTK